MPNVDNATITKLYDPSIVSLSGGVTLAGYFDDHPLGATYQAADTLVSHRRWYNAGAALTQYLHCRTGTVYVRVGNVSTADVSGWAWVQTGATTLPFGWRKLFDSSSLELADLTRLGVARAGDNADIVSMGKLTSIASSVKMAANLEVASSIQANYRMGIMRANDYEAYMSFTSRVGTVSAANLPSALTSMGNMYFRVANTLTDTDPHAGRALGGLSSAIHPAGEGVMRMDARDETGTIKARIICDGQNDMVQIANGVLRPESGISLSSSNTNSVIRGKNDAVILRDHNNGNTTLAASLKEAGSLTGGTLYIGYNRPEANIFTSAVSIDSPVTVNETMKVVKDATFVSAMTVAGGLTLNTALPVSSGGTGAKTATDALKNLGGLPSNGTAVAATKLATARKIAGVAFDGTKDIGISAANVGAYPQSGGNVGGYVNATYLSATQPANPGKEVQGTFIGWNETNGQGESHFINNRGGGVGGFTFRTVNSNNTQQTGYVRFNGVGDLNAQGNISADTGGVYEMGQRVYSPNNRQPVNTNTANLGGGWWRCGDTGMIKQWGYVNKGSRGWSTVNFPIPFPNACANVQVTVVNGGGGTFVDNFGTAQIINNIGFTCGQDSNGSYWEATGW
ncbi:gp53-like domain-containing protein [Rahnella bonaserana]|uniref:gp53-like domain-containing protein n=1 Tax=Rahnella bonaserana TaxID=2816248 RepID=UPI003D184329